MATYRLLEEGCAYDIIEVASADDALDEAESNVDSANYPDRTKTIWVTVYAVNVADEDDVANGDVRVDPDEPPCERGCEHDWQTPHAIVGGLKENPGVRGHGGGVICTSVCVVCGCALIHDGWAQNPSNGEQGLDSVEYDTDQYVDDVARWREAIEAGATAAGKEWAEREAEALPGPPDGPWTCTTVEARGISLDAEYDLYDSQREAWEIDERINSEASFRWDQLVSEAEEAQSA